MHLTVGAGGGKGTGRYAEVNGTARPDIRDTQGYSP